MAREIDAAVAEAMGIEVLGEAWCWNPDGSGWDIHWWADESKDGGTYGVLRPVYLSHCACDYYANDPLAQEIVEFETKRYGHYRQCLEMVAHYSSDISAAWQVWLRIPMKIGDRNCCWAMSNPNFEGQVSIWRQLVGQPTYELVAEGSPPLAICLAFLKAMGKEIMEQGEHDTEQEENR